MPGRLVHSALAVLFAGVFGACARTESASAGAPEVAAAATERVIPAPPETGFFTTGDGERIYYEVTGLGEPVVLSHGLGGNHAIWYQQVSDLGFDYQVITWDQRGFGQSTNVAGAASPAKFAEDLAALLDHLKIGRAHLVGQSMGGWTVLGFALANPDRVRSLTLADTLAGIYTPVTQAAFDAFIRTVLAGGGPPEHLGNHPALGGQLAGEDLAKAFLYRQISGAGPAAPRAIPGLLRSTAFPLEEVASLPMPVLFIVGGSDPIFPPEAIRDAATVIPASRVIVIPQTGHSPYFERPEEWNAALRDFLSESASALATP